MSGTLVVVGHGMVGHRLLEALAERGALSGPGGPGWHAVVLAEEPQPAYDRVHLSSRFTGTTAEGLTLGEAGFFDEHGIELRLGDPVTAVDRDARQVTTASGRVQPYDALVLATGSAPFVPPIEGAEGPGSFTYRTLADVHAITAAARSARSGAVVGGGLLGLEAAGALRSLGLGTSVVEFAPRLMPLQVDAGGAAALQATIEGMGVSVRTGVGAAKVERAAGDGDRPGAVQALVLTDGSRIETDLVLFSAGVRPRDTLARRAGLLVGERGGVSVDKFCRSVDPDVYAIGECAEVCDGQVYGLVAPGYRMAEVVAEQLAGDGELEFTGADTDTKLKLLGADVASFGDPFHHDEHTVELLFSDSSQGVYKKLVLGADGRLLGGILVGDATAYASLRPHTATEQPLPVAAETFLLPQGGGTEPGADLLPDEAVVCSCHNVTKGRVRSAVAEEGLTDLAGIKRCTKAGTGCGGCAGALEALLGNELAAAGIERSKGLCEHFELSRVELYAAIRADGLTGFAEVLAAHGTGGEGTEGCVVCKPTVAGILAVLGPELGLSHILDGEQAGLQDSNDRYLANLQKDGSYSVVPRIPGGELSPQQLIAIGEVARDFDLYTKITGGQRIDLFGARADQLPAIWRRLVDAGFESGHAYGKSLRTVKSCVGSTWCRFGQGDSVQLAIDLELRYRGLRTPHKVKGGVSGCLRECAEARGKDIGVIATANGWNLYVGGNGGTNPRHADLLAADLSAEGLLRLVDRLLMYYARTGERLERTSAWLERLPGGVEGLRRIIQEDSEGLCADLDAQMAAHVAGYRDEWQAVLEDPAKLRRFAPFINATDAVSFQDDALDPADSLESLQEA